MSVDSPASLVRIQNRQDWSLSSCTSFVSLGPWLLSPSFTNRQCSSETNYMSDLLNHQLQFSWKGRGLYAAVAKFSNKHISIKTRASVHQRATSSKTCTWLGESKMDFVQRMKRALQRGRSDTLPPGELELHY